MKRCPQCEFIYEDDQSLCDMDGVLLVLDSRTLPNPQALAPVPSKAQPRRKRAVPAFATLILALVLGMVYYVSTQRQAASRTYSPANVTTIPAPQPAPSAEAHEPPAAPAVEEPKPATATKERVVAPAKKPAPKATTSPQTKPSTAAKKEDSKVSSILKKTGRILKKPFKL
jgi:hypothetical protein